MPKFYKRPEALGGTCSSRRLARLSSPSVFSRSGNVHLCVVLVFGSSRFRSSGTTFRECRVSMSSKFPTSQAFTQIVILNNRTVPCRCLPHPVASVRPRSDFDSLRDRLRVPCLTVPRRMCQNLDDVPRWVGPRPIPLSISVLLCNYGMHFRLACKRSRDPLCPLLREVAASPLCSTDVRVFYISTDIIRVPHNKRTRDMVALSPGYSTTFLNSNAGLPGSELSMIMRLYPDLPASICASASSTDKTSTSTRFNVRFR